ncbi:MAG: UDP-2,3-diacylglucosamine diphosphatase [Ideonella sp. MAG2]|nr:MAG: UDP-2,3-diacylglucosamine diphosphatase [Ideonella sp. MAG2]
MPPVEPPPQLELSAQTVDFVSDLHLCPELPRTVVKFEHYLQHTRADALVLLGDVFEAWVGDDVLAQDFEARLTRALHQFSRGRPLLLMRGNRDFLLGSRFFDATGAVELPDPCLLSSPHGRALLTHGDAWCVADHAYQQFRAQVRSPAWQAAFLAKPLAERLAVAQALRSASQAHQQDPNHSHADVDLSLAAAWLQVSPSAVMVHGHTHRPGTEVFGQGSCRHVLSDWDLDHASTPRAQVLRWVAEGWLRLSPDDC